MNHVVFPPTGTLGRLTPIFRDLGYTVQLGRRATPEASDASDEETSDEEDELASELESMSLNEERNPMCAVKAFKGFREHEGRIEVDVLFKDKSREWVPDVDERLPLCSELFALFEKVRSVYLLARVSTTKQDESISNAVQVQKMREFIANGNYLREDTPKPEDVRVRVVQCVGSSYHNAHQTMRLVAENANPGDIVVVSGCDRFGRDGFDVMSLADSLIRRGCHFVAVDMAKELTIQKFASARHPVNADAYMAAFAKALHESAQLSRKSHSVRKWCLEVRKDSVKTGYGWRVVRQDVDIGNGVVLTGAKGRRVSVPDPRQCEVLRVARSIPGADIYELAKYVEQHRIPPPGRYKSWNQFALVTVMNEATDLKPGDPRLGSVGAGGRPIKRARHD